MADRVAVKGRLPSLVHSQDFAWKNRRILTVKVVESLNELIRLTLDDASGGLIELLLSADPAFFQAQDIPEDVRLWVEGCGALNIREFCTFVVLEKEKRPESNMQMAQEISIPQGRGTQKDRLSISNNEICLSD